MYVCIYTCVCYVHIDTRIYWSRTENEMETAGTKGFCIRLEDSGNSPLPQALDPRP